ncbi:MAG: phage protease [Bacteroidota bacterium]
MPPGDEDSQEWILILPFQRYTSHHGGAHEVTRAHGQEMLANFSRQQTDLLFDVGHASVWDASAKAAGWSDGLEVREDGLWCKYPTWTSFAASAVEGREYRYISPAYRLEDVDTEGNAVGARLLSVALTNTPYLHDQLPAIVNSDVGAPDHDPATQLYMEREQLIQKLGLDADATDAQIDAKLEELTATPEPADDAKQSSKTGGGVSDSDLTAQVKALTSSVQAIADKLEAKEKAEEEADATEKAETLVSSAVQDGKILPKDKQAYLNSALHDYDGTKADLDAKKPGSEKPGRVKTSSEASGEKPKPSTSTSSRRARSYVDQALDAAD